MRSSYGDELPNAMMLDTLNLGRILLGLLFNMSSYFTKEQADIFVELNKNILPNEWNEGEKYSTMKEFIHGMLTSTVVWTLFFKMCHNARERCA